MSILTYESLKAEQAWMVVSEQLQQRNALLSKGITQMERHSGALPIASRLMILRYHLRMSLRKLTQEARSTAVAAESPDQIQQQWSHIHQLFFLLRQIDHELLTAKLDSDAFRNWIDSLESRVYRSALVHLN